MKKVTREEWLNKLATQLEKVLFKKHADLIVAEKPDGKLLPTYRITCGWPAGGKKRQSVSNRIGECWSASQSADGTHEVIISMSIDDPMRVADILAHELVHVAVGNGNGHNKIFGALARAVLLEGKLTATVAGDEFKAKIQPVLDKIGPYPHAALKSPRAVKEQATWLTAVCRHTGFNVRISGKNLREFGTPICPCCQQLMNIS